MSTYALAQPKCEFGQWQSYRGARLLSHPSVPAYLFSSTHMAVDADGAPNAYHPEDVGLDLLGNAGYPDHDWWRSILVPDPKNPTQAFTQPAGEFAGYFVSKTSLQDKSKAVTDPARYVDSRTVPYLVVPGPLYRMKGTGLLGDLGYAVNLSSGEKTAFVVGDTGPSDQPLGEVSIALAEGLGGEDVNPRNGAGIPRGEILYIVFPYSSRTYSWPLSVDEIRIREENLVKEAGGIESILACKNEL